jgi:hypothetical protein
LIGGFLPVGMSFVIFFEVAGRIEKMSLELGMKQEIERDGLKISGQK